MYFKYYSNVFLQKLHHTYISNNSNLQHKFILILYFNACHYFIIVNTT